ncbi:MAG: uridylate kinase [Thermodesulfobacteriota bacterium]|nr:uridylate kinase [Thermodesulfobacteriota bacterium]
MRRPQGYKTALIKISGEALAGNKEFGFDRDTIYQIASEMASASERGVRLGLVLGGGNIFRGSSAEDLGITPILGDHVGMTATVLNALIMRSALETLGVGCRVLSAFAVGNFVELFEMDKAREYLAGGRILIFAGGTGNPCFTTDSAAALRAVQMDADVMIKATQVDGVFDRDPRKFPDAVFFETITPREVIAMGLQVMDAASAEILGRKKVPIIVLNLHQPGNMLRALAGESVGTLIGES